MTASNGFGADATRNFTLTVNQAPIFTSSAANVTYTASPVTVSFTDISSTGTKSINAVGDDTTDTLSPAQLNGFTFPLFGTTYNSVSFSTNGLITFTSPFSL